MKFVYAIIVLSKYYRPCCIACTNSMADAMDEAIKAKALYEGANVDRGDNCVMIKRKLY